MGGDLLANRVLDTHRTALGWVEFMLIVAELGLRDAVSTPWPPERPPCIASYSFTAPVRPET